MAEDLAILINQLDIGTRVIRALDAKGEIPKLTSSRYDLQIGAEDLTKPEFSYLRKESRFVGAQTSAAFAAETSFVWIGFPLANVPGRAPVLAHVYQLTLENGSAAAMSLHYGLSSAAGDGVGGGGPADDRQNAQGAGFASVPMMLINANHNAAAPLGLPNCGRVLLPATSSITIPVDFFLTNKQPVAGATTRLQLYVQGNTVNSAVAATFWWTERPILSSELL